MSDSLNRRCAHNREPVIKPRVLLPFALADRLLFDRAVFAAAPVSPRVAGAVFAARPTFNTKYPNQYRAQLFAALSTNSTHLFSILGLSSTKIPTWFACRVSRTKYSVDTRTQFTIRVFTNRGIPPRPHSHLSLDTHKHAEVCVQTKHTKTLNNSRESALTIITRALVRLSSGVYSFKQ
jgi:hypothetical protein